MALYKTRLLGLPVLEKNKNQLQYKTQLNKTNKKIKVELVRAW